MHYAINERRSHLVVTENHAPFGELDVGRDNQASLLVAIAHDLEQKPCSFSVERHISKLIDYQKPRLGNISQQLFRLVLSICLRKLQHQLGRSAKTRFHAEVHACQPDSCSQVGFASSCLPVENEVLRGVDEREPLQGLDAVIVGKGYLGEVVALKGFDLGNLAFLGNRSFFLRSLTSSS